MTWFTRFNFSILHVDEVIIEWLVLVVLVDLQGVVLVVVRDAAGGGGVVPPHRGRRQRRDKRGGESRQHGGNTVTPSRVTRGAGGGEHGQEGRGWAGGEVGGV